MEYIGKISQSNYTRTCSLKNHYKKASSPGILVLEWIIEQLEHVWIRGNSIHGIMVVPVYLLALKCKEEGGGRCDVQG